MNIAPSLFEAFLNCPTHCWLRATGETPSGNAYAEWVQAQTETYRTTETERLLAETPPSESARSPSPEDLKASKWRLAVDVAARTPELPRSSRRQEAHSSVTQLSDLNAQPSDQSLVTSAATDQGAASPTTFTAETHLQAVERVPSEARGKSAQFIPIRFVFRNKLTKDDRLLLAFDAFVLSTALGREIALGKIIHGDLRGCARESAANSENQAAGQQTGMATAALSRAQPRILKVKTSALTGEVRKRLEKIAALLSSPTPPDLVLNRHCAECEFQARCRKIAVEKDDLSLLATMNAKEYGAPAKLDRQLRW
jgi:CRISPR/Cas system-associated exonuclease Cas4 (RecB family)